MTIHLPITHDHLAVLDAAWQRHGAVNQLGKSAEESAEFAAAVIKWLIGDDDGTRLAEEAADVVICQYYILRWFAQSPEQAAALEQAIDRKVARLAARLNDGGVV